MIDLGSLTTKDLIDIGMMIFGFFIILLASNEYDKSRRKKKQQWERFVKENIDQQGVGESIQQRSGNDEIIRPPNVGTGRKTVKKPRAQKDQNKKAVDSAESPRDDVFGIEAERQERASKSEKGKVMVRRYLLDKFKDEKTYLFNDVTLPYWNKKTESPTTIQIDHIFITLRGVFVIEARNWAGMIYVKENYSVWKVNDHLPLNPVEQNAHHVRVVQEKLDFLQSSRIHNVVVFTGDADFKFGMPRRTVLLDDLENHLSQHRKQVLSDDQFKQVVDHIQSERLSVRGEAQVI